jgi:DNA modification methylase
MYSHGADYKFYPERIQIPKVTAGTSLDKKGTGMKTPCDVFDDLGNFHTTSKERFKLNGKNIQWQKPLKLMNRLLLPISDPEDIIFDPFMGSGSTGEWCKQNNRHFIGLENSKDVFDLAYQRLIKD